MQHFSETQMLRGRNFLVWQRRRPRPNVGGIVIAVEFPPSFCEDRP